MNKPEASARMSVADLVEKLQLKPHPEGGFYREIYRSAGIVSQEALGDRFSGDRNYSTSIYFLLTSGSFSAFHRIKQDELWHFYLGTALQIHCIDPNGKLTTHLLGNDIAGGESLQVIIPADCWFASGVVKSNSYSLVGCTVSPGFDFNDFELARRSELITLYPQHSGIIEAFTTK